MLFGEEKNTFFHPLHQALPLLGLFDEEGGIIGNEGTTSPSSIIGDLHSSDKLLPLQDVIIIFSLFMVLLEEG